VALQQPKNISTPSNEVAKVLVKDVIRFIQAKDAKSALLHLNILKQQLALSNTSSTTFGSVKLLVADAIQNLQRNDMNGALIHLNILMQELGSRATVVATAQNQTNTLGVANTRSSLGSFRTYVNPLLRFKLQYPSNWVVTENRHFAEEYQSGQNQVVTFYASIGKNPSSIGQYVTVSVIRFGGYLGTLQEYISSVVILDEFGLNKPLSSTHNVTLSGYPAFQYVYTDTQGNSFKVMKIITLAHSGRIYEISYTSDIATFQNNLATVQEMIKSFQFIKNLQNTANNESATEPFVQSHPPQPGLSTYKHGLCFNPKSDYENDLCRGFVNGIAAAEDLLNNDTVHADIARNLGTSTGYKTGFSDGNNFVRNGGDHQDNSGDNPSQIFENVTQKEQVGANITGSPPTTMGAINNDTFSNRSQTPTVGRVNSPSFHATPIPSSGSCYGTADAGPAWMKGYRDGQADFQGANGHGFNDSTHLADQTNYKSGYRTGWDDASQGKNGPFC
jgi:photosystem II reaction center protein PsbP